ncbi:LDH2 family malate/lactate/ureidoglycolate dehydrogenase [Limimaricola soesokkakensis]|uniref:LDH2 family malate/lactate/ureidoglycolate dehydrogenase n=1 Tax=Limimaricola soesokkakensis TaxID=1343159 RepID=A0A1X6ZNV7_9RHOB|nr:Ldh family oxidoreductase [Limimaricola soesokkakensis]PSK85784.1 LDH2 family malate/lactate/ureidoglycolate dehydrogenase [Limimaricola soesokkakensis]SLN57149.1 putative oxidoreductase YjmC [Limimaricola soesokkakensis]
MSESIAATARLDRQKLSEQAREAIRDRIVQGAFPLGRKLPEAELVELLSMSKSPIREALLQLEREGLVEMAAGRSARVFSMGAAEIAELGELRQMLELQAMRMALERNPGQLQAALDSVTARMEEALSRGDTGTYKLFDHDFHDAIFDNCGNSFVRDNFRRLSFRVQALRNRLSLDDALNQKSLGEHIAIAEAVAAGRDEAAVALLSTHIGDTIEAYLARLTAETEPVPEALTQVRVALEEMERFSRAALAAVGADDPTIEAVTKALLHASALGVDTHGFRLLPHYLQGLSEGRLNRAPKLEIVHETGGACVLEADNAHGARAGYAAVERALELARTHGLAAVAIRGSSHFGAAGAYALEIARHGMMGLAFCNSDSFVRLHGGAVRFHGTNPIAAAAPAGEGEPWLLDMATSAIPFNRVQLNRSLGTALPEDVASDARGANVTDPAIVEMLAPLGGALFGYKGAGLAGLAEIFSTAFSDAPLSFELPPMISDDMATPRRLGAFVMALDPEAFGGRAVFEAVIRRYLAAIAASPAAPGETVMAPGAREWAEAERRRAQGMKLDRGSVEALARFAEARGIEPLRYRSGGR